MNKHEFLKKTVSGKYKETEEGIIVEGTVTLNNCNLNYFPVNFYAITGDFLCSNNKLTTLKGGPKHVMGIYDCRCNDLTSLQYAPVETHHFICSDNYLTTLDFSPSKMFGDFLCSNNELTSLKGSPKEINTFNCSYNKLTDLLNGPIKVNGSYYCHNNNLITLNGVANLIRGSFYCNCNDSNLLLFGLKDIYGKIYYDDNIINHYINHMLRYQREDINYEYFVNYINSHKLYDVLRYAPIEIRKYFTQALLKDVDNGVYI